MTSTKASAKRPTATTRRVKDAVAHLHGAQTDATPGDGGHDSATDSIELHARQARAGTKPRGKQSGVGDRASAAVRSQGIVAPRAEPSRQGKQRRNGGRSTKG